MFVGKITVGKMTKDKMTACIIIADSVTTDKMIAVDVSVHQMAEDGDYASTK